MFMKPKIVTEKDGKLIMLIVRCRSESQSDCVWSFKETTVTETRTMKIVHESIKLKMVMEDDITTCQV